MTVLTLGVDGRTEIEMLAAAVRDAGGAVRSVDLNEWPGAPYRFSPGDDDCRLVDDLALDDVTGVYVDTPALFRSETTDVFDGFDGTDAATRNQLREHRAAFESLVSVFEANGVPTVPGVDAHRLQHRKPFQLDRFAAADLPVPETVFTNDPAAAERFLARHDRVVYKPTTAGAPPAELTADELPPDRRESLRTAPVQFQAFVPGVDVRAYVVDGDVIGAMQYEADRFSFKLDQVAGDEVSVSRVELPESAAETAVRAVDLVGATYGGVDFRRRPDGTHVLLEVNQTPKFAGADESAGVGVADALADFLREA